MNSSSDIPWPAWRRRACLTGAAGLLLWVVGAIVWPAAAFPAWWFAWVFWTGVSLGSLLVCLLLFLVRGTWSFAVQRFAEAGTATLSLAALLFLPVLPGLHDVFPWAAAALHDAPHKNSYLVPWAFVARTILYFALLIPLAARLRYWSKREESSPLQPEASAKLRRLGAGGLVLVTVCLLFASTDWIMSLEPAWFSSMFVVIVGISQLLTALAGSIALVILLAPSAGFRALLDVKCLRDLGNLLMAMVIFWIYVTFGQFLIIWSGNLPREIAWYVHRDSPLWKSVVVLLALLQFGVPFAFLLFRATKEHPQRLARVALLVFCSNILHVWWLVMPPFDDRGAARWWLGAAAFAGIGGIWIWRFLGALISRPLLSAPAMPPRETLKMEVRHA